MATERIVLEIDSKGARVVSRDITRIGDESKKADRNVKLLRRAVGGLSAVLLARKVLRYADAWTELNNQMRANLPITANIADEGNRVLKIAQNTRAPLAEVAKLYSQTTAAAEELGASQDQVARLTEITGKSLAVAGVSANTASGALLQLTQLLGGGVVQAQEFNSLIDGARPLLKAVATGIDRFGGSVAKLREEVKTGTLTSKEFFEGALKGGALIDSQFARTTQTIGQARTQLDNALTAFIGKVNDAEGGTALLAEALNDLTAFFEDPANIESAKLLGGAIVTSLQVALEAITFTIDGVHALAEELGRLVHGGNDLPTLTADLVDAGNTLQAFTAHSADVKTLWSYIKGLGESASKGFEPGAVVAMEKIARADSMLQGIVEKGSIVELRSLAVTASTQMEELSVTYNSLVGVEGARAKEQRENLESLISVWQQYGREAAEAISASTPAIKKQLKDEVPTALGGDSGSIGLTAKELAKLEKELSRLITKAAPARGAILELARAENILEDATKQGLISKVEEGKLLELLKKQYVDILDPLGEMNRVLDNQIKHLSLVNDEREISNQLFAANEEFQKKGITLTKEENDALREKLILLQETTRQRGVIESITSPQREFKERAEDVSGAIRDGGITSGQGALDTITSSGDLLDFEGTETRLQASVELHRTAFEQIAVLRDNLLIDDQTANQLRAKADIKLTEQRINTARKVTGTLSTLASSENKKLAALGKAAAITQATIDGVLAVQKALASAPPPANFALAAAVGVATAANVASIASARRLGGDLNENQLARVGEGSRPEIFKSHATGEQFFIPPERGQVNPLVPVQPGNNSNRADAQPIQNTFSPEIRVKSVVVLDKGEITDVVFGDETDEIFVSKATRNQDELRQVFGS